MRNEMVGYTIADIILWKIIYNSVEKTQETEGLKKEVSKNKTEKTKT